MLRCDVRNSAWVWRYGTGRAADKFRELGTSRPDALVRKAFRLLVAEGPVMLLVAARLVVACTRGDTKDGWRVWRLWTEYVQDEGWAIDCATASVMLT